MTERSLVRVAVIGQGFMGRAHSLGWARAAELSATRLKPALSLLCGRDLDALRRNAALYGFGRTDTDWRSVVDADDVDLVDICTPGSSHAEIALGALASGKHVLCEKPLANSLQEAQQMARAAAAARDKGVFAMVGFNYRRVPALAAARELIATGRLGALRHVRAMYLQDWLVDPAFPLAWRLDASQAGSGALGDLGAHLIDLVRHLSGEEFTEVVASLETFVKKRPVGMSSTEPANLATGPRIGQVTVDDAFVALARLSGGALVTIEATRMASGRKNALLIELNGAKMSLSFNLERLNELRIYDRDTTVDGFTTRLVTDSRDPYAGQWWPPGHTLGWEHTFVHQFQDLLNAIAAGNQPEPSFGDGLATQVVLDAIQASATDHAWTKVGTGTPPS
ncbi:MAG: Gfo/Idh/MocA family protein [Acidimicrobiales bacterium]